MTNHQHRYRIFRQALTDQTRNESRLGLSSQHAGRSAARLKLIGQSICERPPQQPAHGTVARQTQIMPWFAKQKSVVRQEEIYNQVHKQDTHLACKQTQTVLHQVRWSRTKQLWSHSRHVLSAYIASFATWHVLLLSTVSDFGGIAHA